MTDILVYKCGTSVKIKNIDLKGFITGISIRDERITYEISYFMNNTYYTHNFCEYELEIYPFSDKIQIGFK
jgi:hypothetical protein